MSKADALVLAGVVCVGAGVYFWAGWPIVLVWVGLLMVLAGVAEARKKT